MPLALLGVATAPPADEEGASRVWLPVLFSHFESHRDLSFLFLFLFLFPLFFYFLHPLRITPDRRGTLLSSFQLFGIHCVASFIFLFACATVDGTFSTDQPALCHFPVDDRPPEWTLLLNSIARN